MVDNITNPRFTIEFAGLSDSDFEQTTSRRVAGEIERLSMQMAKKGVSFDLVRVVFAPVEGNPGIIVLDINFTDGPEHVIEISRVIDVKNRSLLHASFSIFRETDTGKRIPRDVFRLSRVITEQFRLNHLTTTASLEDGAYTWLRYGIFPYEVEDLDSIMRFAYRESKVLTEAEFNRWSALTLKEKKEFVFTDEFRNYREALRGQEWTGGADLDDPEVRKRIFGPVNLGDVRETRPYRLIISEAKYAGDNQRQYAQFKKDVEILAATWNRKDVDFELMRAAFFVDTSNGRNVVETSIQALDQSGDIIMRAKRTVDLSTNKLHHNEFIIHDKTLRRKGLGSDVLRVSKGLVESFNLNEITLSAALNNGSYTWLRYGYYPFSPNKLDAIFLDQENKTLTPAQVRRWMRLTDAEKREFVKSPRFRKYKRAMKGNGWEGGARVGTEAERDLVFSLLKETEQSRNMRIAMETFQDRANTHAIAEARVDRNVARARGHRDAQLRGIGTPAFAQLTDRYIAYGIDTAALDTNMKATILEIYERIELELVDAIRKVDPGASSLPSAREQRLRTLLKQTQVILTDGQEAIRGFAFTELSNLATFEASFTASAINAVIGVEVATSSITSAQINKILGDTLINGAPSREWWARQDSKVRNAFADTVRVGLLQGESIEQIVSRVQGSYTGRRVPYRTRGGNLRFKSEYTGGVLQATRREAVALVRTSALAVANKVREDTIKENRDVVKGMQFLATLDARTSEICQLHSALVWDTAGNPIGHGNGYPGAPPLHFNCRSTLVPVLREWADLSSASKSSIAAKIDERESLKLTTQASASGQVRADLNYEQWLQTLDPSKQESILGKKRFKLWQDGEIFITAPMGT